MICRCDTCYGVYAALPDELRDINVIDDSSPGHPQTLSLAERLERAVYLGFDRNGITAKYVRGKKVYAKTTE